MKTKLLLPTCILAALYGCQSVPEQSVQTETSCVQPITANFNSVLSAPNKGWSECFNHQQSGLFDSVLAQISELTKQSKNKGHPPQQLEDLLYYLRAYSYYAELNELTDSQWQLLNQTLKDVANMPQLAEQSDASYRLSEHLLVAFYQYLGHKNNPPTDGFISPFLTKAIARQELTQDSQQYDYQLLEMYRAIGFLAYQARRQNKLKSQLVNSGLTDTLVEHTLQLTQNDWRLNNALWALASLHYLLPEEEKNKVDQKVTEHIFDNLRLPARAQKQLFSQNYLVNSYRYHEQCADDFKGQCLIPTIDEILPINHDCSETIFIRASAMNEVELATTCQRLTSQESFFHTSLDTKKQPVRDDFNTRLRVVIFDNYSEYNRWGQLFFNIGTDNGGMYIEGKPEQQGNQATFYSFEAFWRQPTFAVWNLNHEYVHYLDGRYVKYGTYGHFPSHTVWWSEGLAEYISVQKQNRRAFALLNQAEQQDWPTLEQIFATTYSDGLNRVYRWSYLAVRFIFEQHTVQGQKFAKALKSDDFPLYQQELEQFAKQYQDDFTAWLLANKSAKSSGDNTAQKLKKYDEKALYRYLYRDYLRPQHLPINAQHKHISNWG